LAPVDAPRTRRSFARLSKALDVPNLIDIQKKSFAWLTDPQTGGLRETIDDISPIEDYTGNLAVQFGEFVFDEPVASLDECREKDLTYARPLTVTVAFVNRETGEIREQSVFMGDFPWMTERGTFIINGTERVVVTQLVRSPGAYLMEAKDREKQVFIANLMPARGSWLELEIDKKGKVYVRIDRKRKLPVTVLLRAMGYASDEEILKLFEDSHYIRNTIEADPEVTKTEEGALIELFKKQRPGEPPSVDAAGATSSTAACISTSTSRRARSPTTTSSRSSRSSSRCRGSSACRRTPSSRSETMRPRPSASRASRSPTTSTSTSISATVACAPSAS
jgi:DNA-directed RNA polymerase subunit beta